MWTNLYNQTKQLVLRSKRINQELRFSSALELAALRMRQASKEAAALPGLNEAYSLLCTCREQFANALVPISTEALLLQDQLLSKVRATAAC